MNLEIVKETMTEINKGANIVICWTRPAKTRKGVENVIEKHVRMVGRIGIEFDNIKVVQEKRESGELPAENQGLKWGRFEIYPYLIEHKGTRYLKLYKGTSDIIKPKVSWTMDGQEIQKNEIASLLLKSELDSAEGDCFVVKTDCITRLHTEMAEVEIEQERELVTETPETVVETI